VARQIGPAQQHVRGWRPAGPEGLAADARDTLPQEALAADADAIFDRPAIAERKVQLARSRVDGDDPGGFAGGVGDQTPDGLGFVHLGIVIDARRIGGVRVGWERGDARSRSRREVHRRAGAHVVVVEGDVSPAARAGRRQGALADHAAARLLPRGGVDVLIIVPRLQRAIALIGARPGVIAGRRDGWIGRIGLRRGRAGGACQREGGESDYANCLHGSRTRKFR
jgi:hypothetical protein